MTKKNIIINKIKSMPDELLSKVLIFIAGMEAQKNINAKTNMIIKSKK